MKSTQETITSKRARRTLAMRAGLTIALLSVAAGLMFPASAPPQQAMTLSASWAEYWTAVGRAAGTF